MAAFPMKKRAIISVSDKTGVVAFAKGLEEQGYEIISTGGTAKSLEEAGVKVTPVETVTGFPECFSGRVKTMHPLLMGGILFMRGNEEHRKQAEEQKIEPIDVVVVNLYPFEETAKDASKTEAELIEQIDIGGPTLLRSAAKNHADVTVICDHTDYSRVLDEIKNGGTSLELRRELALKVFAKTAAYDSAISETLSKGENKSILLKDKTALRYGENPHQWGTFYDIVGESKNRFTLHQGKELSYLNILDTDGAIELVYDFDAPAAACIKHANPSGVAVDTTIENAFQKSYDADRLSAFGVIVSLNRPCSKGIVEKMIDQKIFVEVIVAPSFDADALELLKSKPNIRAIEFTPQRGGERISYRSMLGGMLVQNVDQSHITKNDLKCVTDIKPTDAQIEDLLFAFTVVKHAKSNAIVFAKDLVTVGIGCGQTSRVDSTIIAARRAGERAQGAVMASDAFFPFPDSIEEAAKNGISAIIQPGGSMRDAEVIAKANELKIPMVLTGVRVFRH